MPKRSFRVLAVPVLGVLAAALLSAGCARRQALTAVSAGSPQPLPPLRTRGTRPYHVLRGDSQLRIRVYRGGPLAEVGHNHVITTSDILGTVYVREDIVHSGFQLRVPLASLRVDEAAKREQEGSDFRTHLTRSDRMATRRNMLGSSVLDVARHPDLRLRSVGAVGPPWYPRINVRVTLHGVSRDYTVPTAIVRCGSRIVAVGGLTLRQSDFGIKPFSVLAGGLRVLDKLDVTFRLVLVPESESVRREAGRGAGHGQRTPVAPQEPQ